MSEPAAASAHARASTSASPACRRSPARSLEVAAGRGACAGRPERRRQVDHDQDPDRRLPQGRRRDHLRRPAVRRSPRRRRRSAAASARSTRRSTSSPTARWPRTSSSAASRAASACSTGAAMNREADELLRRFDVDDRRHAAADELQHRHPADGGDRPRGLVRGQARHHGRADLARSTSTRSTSCSTSSASSRRRASR